jgi:hypothetical protein
MTECCTPPPLVLPPRPDRLPLIREAFRLEWMTIGWMTIEAIVAIASGWTASSLVLIAFGLANRRCGSAALNECHVSRRHARRRLLADREPAVLARL